MDDAIGKIEPPAFINKYSGVEGGGLILFFNNLIRLLMVAGGLYAFLNFILAGFQFMNAGGDPKAVSNAWNKIWQSLVGLAIIAISFVLASILGYLLFGDATAILNPKIYGPE